MERSTRGVVMNEPPFTVLVVDDEPSLRAFVLAALQGGGFHAIEAVNEAQGLALFKQHQGRIKLVILDMVMPGMSGLDLAAELERQRPGIKILYLSGHGSSIAMESILRQSADRVLLKPITGPALLERVSLILKTPDGDGARTREPAG
jgi:DNA-binding response OmpR family regulator